MAPSPYQQLQDALDAATNAAKSLRGDLSTSSRSALRDLEKRIAELRKELNKNGKTWLAEIEDRANSLTGGRVGSKKPAPRRSTARKPAAKKAATAAKKPARKTASAAKKTSTAAKRSTSSRASSSRSSGTRKSTTSSRSRSTKK